MRRLARVLTCLVLLACAPLVHAQSGGMPSQPDFTKLLTFETDHPSGVPSGWRGGPPGTLFADDKIAHGGRWSARLEVPTGKEGGSALTQAIPVEFTGTRVELRGFLRTESVSGFAGLWLREDSDTGTVAFANMQSRQIKGTTEWTQYSITLPLRAEARTLFFGTLLSGSGKAWVDDLELLVDGKPIWDAPRVERPKTAIDLDHAFDAGSGIVLDSLSPQQVENLAALGRVWGFLKYHHPAVTTGTRHWDYDLFRVMPAVIAAHDRAEANAALLAWVNKLGPITPCTRCATLKEDDLHLRPQIEWLTDEAMLGAELSRTLREIYRNRPASGQFYVSLVAGVGNPAFDHELPYQALRLPDAGYQILSLFRFWNIIQYWSPYRDVMGADWNSVLERFIPRIALANDSKAYQLELMALIATVNDTHANLWSSLAVRPPTGACQLPVHVRFVENSAVVAAYTAEATGAASGLKIGDALTELDGKPVSDLVQSWRPYYAASNEPTRLRDIARALTTGTCGEAVVGVRREARALTLRPVRLPIPKVAAEGVLSHDLPGDGFRLLSNKVAYLKLSSVKSAELAKQLESAAATQGLIVDIRNYPADFVVFALGQILVTKSTAFARFTGADLQNPGAFYWTQPLALGSGKTHYAGKVVVLVDEVSQSNAEYTAMALRAAGALVVGSTTAGADGNVSAVPLPGGFRSMISGIGVFYPDKKPTQRLGIVPDVTVRPTIAGIRAGRDEVLEEALRQILGRNTPAAEIEKIVRDARAMPAGKQPSTAPRP